MFDIVKQFIAEIIGTANLVFFGCGVGIRGSPEEFGFAFGAIIVASAYSIGNISGCHLNPAVSIGLAIRKLITWNQFILYVIAQFIGGFLGAVLLALINRCDFKNLGGNTIGELLKKNGSLDFKSYFCAFIIEIILTFVFVYSIVGVTDKRYHNGNHAGIVIGISLALICFVGGDYTGPSVNPARSFAPAVLQFFFKEPTALEQIWIFLIAPMIGGALAPIVYEALSIKNNERVSEDKNKEDEAKKPEAVELLPNSL